MAAAPSVGTDVDAAVAVLRAGGLVAFPTETVYGLGADASRPEAVAGIFEAKGRPTGHPLIVHFAPTVGEGSATGLDRFGRDVGPLARSLAGAFWPGPLTVVVGRSDAVAPETVGGLDTVGLRVPDHPMALDLLRRFGGGVAAPSANRFGSVSPTTAAHVVDDLGRAVDLVLDGGPSAVGVESTIVDATGPEPVLLRPGGIAAVEIEAVVGRPVVDGRTGPARASGMLASHYAPEAGVELVAGAELRAIEPMGPDGGPDLRYAVIAPFAHPHPRSWHLPADAAGFAARLYATLRAADDTGVERILVAPPTTGNLLDAVLDRLAKAAAPRPERSG